ARKGVHAVKEELDKLRGVWVCAGYEKDGEERGSKEAKESLQNEELWFQPNTVKGSWLTIQWTRTAGGSSSAAGVVKLHPTTSPKGIDLTWEAGGLEKNLGKIQPGVYSWMATRLPQAPNSF